MGWGIVNHVYTVNDLTYCSVEWTYFKNGFYKCGEYAYYELLKNKKQILKWII